MPDAKVRKLLDDCFLHDKDRLRHDEAIEILRSRLVPVVGSEKVALEKSYNRILSENVAAPRPVPGYDNSAVDGYAYRADDFDISKGTFIVSDRIAAGHVDPKPMAAGTAVRIFTGAPVPAGADTIAMQEDCEAIDGGSKVAIPPGLKLGANLRKAGEDLSTGEKIAVQGSQLRPQDVAALASIGLSDAPVYKKLSVALLSTGNEIKRPGADLQVGEVYDSNFHLLRSMLDALPVQSTDLGIIPDQADLVETSIAAAAQKFNVVITTGGASRGEEDHIVNTLSKLGNCHLWQLAIKPGRPMSFGQIGNTVFFGLPGNPVASFVCFLLYVRPAILRLAGAAWETPEKYPLPVNFEISKKKPDRREYWRGSIERDDKGGATLSKFERDGSGLISGLRQAGGLIEVPEEITSVRTGDQLDFIPLSQFF